jgi:hypothetical protein
MLKIVMHEGYTIYNINVVQVENLAFIAYFRAPWISMDTGVTFSWIWLGPSMHGGYPYTVDIYGQM